MKQILLSIIFFLFIVQLSAQVTLSLSPDLVMTDVDPTEFETVAHSFITNKGAESVIVKWRRQVEDITMGWNSAICDINMCYSVEVDTTPPESYITLAPGDSSMLDVHIRPFSLDGSAKIKVTVIDVNNAENSVTGEFLFNQVSAAVNQKVESIRIFPNPAIDYFELSNYDRVDQVVVYNLVGQEIRRFNAFPGAKFDLNALQRDIYLVRVMDRRQKVIKTFRLTKR
jgi:hypothetical protein